MRCSREPSLIPGGIGPIGPMGPLKEAHGTFFKTKLTGGTHWGTDWPGPAGCTLVSPGLSLSNAIPPGESGMTCHGAGGQSRVNPRRVPESCSPSSVHRLGAAWATDAVLRSLALA